ncbi:MAG: PolC-type DNA polymerase III [Eubacterium sp.]|nr:PolC-type DNA polymerase III [Eubacterium sp.]
MNLFKDYFGEYVDDDLLLSLGNGIVKRITIKKQEREVSIILQLDKLIAYSEFIKAENHIKEKMLLRKFHINPCYSRDLFNVEYFSSIIEFVSRNNPSAYGFFEDSDISLNENILNISLKKGGLELLKNQGVDTEIKSLILDLFDMSIEVELFEIEKYDIEKEIKKSVVNEKEKKEKSLKKTLLGNLPVYIETVKTVLGKPIKEKPIHISELKFDTGFATVCGDIIKYTLEDTKKGYYKILTFDITDYTSSVTVKLFDRKNVIESVDKRINNAKTLIVSGPYTYDRYLKEYVITADNIQTVLKAEKGDTAKEKRVELHLHTSLSDMDGVSSPSALVSRAIEWGHKAIAITDHGVVQALPEAYKTAKGKIKLILGMEGYLVDDEKYPDFVEMKTNEFKRYHIILLVKEDTSLDESIPKEKRKYGRKNLYELITHSNIKTYKTRPLIPKSLLARKRNGLIVGSACEQGELYQAVLREESNEELKKIASFYDYLEIQPNGNNMFMIHSDKELYEKITCEDDLININKKIIALADELGLPVVATGDVHFLDEKDAKFRSIIMESKGFNDADNQAPLYFKTTDEMLDDFAWAGDRAKEFVIDNPNKIADMVMDDIPPIPPGTFQPHIDGADEELTEKCWSKAKELYGDPVPKYVSERLQRELDSIIGHGFGVLYVIAKRLVEESERNGYLVGSRGSVGSSLAAHLAGISEVNPLAPHYYCKACKHSEFFLHGEYRSGFDLPPKNCSNCGVSMKRDGHEIPFETFLGFDGDKEPDIDLNFSDEYQSQSHRYTKELFGKEYVFKAGTISTVAELTSEGYVMAYLNKRGLANIVSKAEINRLTEGCTGIKRTTGQHPGGMVVVPENYTIEDFTPIQFPSGDSKKDEKTTHFDFKNSLHDTLLKLDELGHKNPTMYKYLEDSTGVSVMDIDLSDPRLYQLITSTEPIGVQPEDIDCNTGTLAIPEMGTPFVMGMLEEAKPKTFADLLQISGLSHGKDVWLGNARDLIQNGICNISQVIGCRDDIMTYLIHKAENYEISTGRKSPLSKKDCFKIMEITRKGKALKELPPFEEAMRTVGVEQWYIDSCYKIKYMFPKAHAAAYVISALRLAWYKIYYPINFYSAYFTVYSDNSIDASLVVKGKSAVKQKMNEIVLNSSEKAKKDINTFSILQIIIEMFARGIDFLPVDIYKSDAKIYMVEDGRIRLPFSAIEGVSENAGKAIIKARNDGNGEFISCDDLMARAGIGKSVVESLKKLGALRDIPDQNQISLF